MTKKDILLTLNIITILILKAKTHTPSKNNDIIVTYTGHSESNNNNNNILQESNNIPKESKNIPNESNNIPKEYNNNNENHNQDNDKETIKTDINANSEVFFVPNSQKVEDGYIEVNRNEKSINVGELIANNGQKSIYDVVKNANSDTVIVEQEPQNKIEDIVFVKGKNDEAESNKNKQDKTKESNTRTLNNSGKELNCENLNCNNTMKTICGGKIEHKQWKYRSFFNECFFRKVNCGLKFDINRYIEVDNEKCNDIAYRNPGRPYFYQSSLPMFNEKLPRTLNETRRVFISRRSSTIDADGVLCNHHCPLTCPDDYVPECALSDSGVKKVFINHCMLDYNSCVNHVAWRRQPLSECIGRRQADVRENRAFISWMQQVGIVDGKGKLVLA